VLNTTGTLHNNNNYNDASTYNNTASITTTAVKNTTTPTIANPNYLRGDSLFNLATMRVSLHSVLVSLW
jgi:hypothetical protein